MKNNLFKLFFTVVSLSIISFVLIDIFKEETFTIVEKDTDSFISIESNKILNPSFKRAFLNLKNAIILNKDGEVIDDRQLVIGNKFKAVFKPTVLFSDPPILEAREVELVN